MAIEPVSPASGRAKITNENRVPMSSGQQKLSVPEIPGFHLHWMRGTPDRLQAALQGGYEFVSLEETRQTNLTLGGDAKKSGNTDMGTRVSHISGGDAIVDGQPERLYLMKIREEWWQEDEKNRISHSDNIRQALNRGLDTEANPSDTSNRYVGKQTTNMFQPKAIRRN